MPLNNICHVASFVGFESFIIIIGIITHRQICAVEDGKKKMECAGDKKNERKINRNNFLRVF